MLVGLINLLFLWINILGVCLFAILLLRPVVKYAILNPKKTSEGFWEKSLLSTYELLIAVVTLEGIVLIPIILFFSLLMPKRRNFLHSQGRFFTKLFLWLLCVKVSIRGEENLPAGPAIYIQHFSNYLDGAATLTTLPVIFRFVFLRRLFEMPFLGWLASTMGYLALEGEVVSIMHDDILEILQVLNRKESIMVSTEGREVRGGAILFAFHAKLPVVPIVIKHHLTSPEVGGFFIKPYPYEIMVKVGKPIVYAGSYDDHNHRQELKQKIEDGLKLDLGY